MIRRLIPAILLFAPACTTTPAERATYDAIAPAHAAYVQNDANLTAQEKQRRLDLLESWRLRVVGGAK